MSPEALAVLDNVVTESVKILGPATIAAIIAYRAGKAQMELRLRELDSQHRFKARFARFEEHRDKQKDLSSSLQEANGAIAQMLGGLSALGPDEALPIGLVEYMSTWLGLLPDSLTDIRDGMEEYSLEEKREYALLLEQQGEVAGLSLHGTPNEQLRSLLAMMKIIYNTTQCNHLIVEEQAEQMLGRYLDDE